ncbi:MAG: class I SAM-dependent methyltransferase [Actinomycetota bacterium]|nr:class I SAM-dependent methyltransferase [Actinomycetota bacterium]
MNFSLLQRRVGPTGIIVGIDRSPQMLHRARRRAAAHGWDNVILIQADMTTLDPSIIGAHIRDSGGSTASEAALATYSLSLMPHWRTAWKNMTTLLRGDARICVVDMQDPIGRARWLAPLARLACALGRADITAHPWRAVEETCTDVTSASTRGGHLQIRAGRLSRPTT